MSIELLLWLLLSSSSTIIVIIAVHIFLFIFMVISLSLSKCFLLDISCYSFRPHFHHHRQPFMVKAAEPFPEVHFNPIILIIDLIGIDESGRFGLIPNR